jgi:cell division protein FtsB
VRRITAQKATLEAEKFQLLAERNELAAKVEQMHEARYGGREKVKASLLQDLGSAADWAGRLQDDPA